MSALRRSHALVALAALAVPADGFAPAARPLRRPALLGRVQLSGRAPAGGASAGPTTRGTTSSYLPLPNQPLPMVEISAAGNVIRYQSTLTSIRSMYRNRLSARDVRLLRSSTPVLAPRQSYALFDLGDLRGILQHDRLTLIGADRPAVSALGAEVQRRLDLAKADGEQGTPFEVRALECILEQVYSVFEETLSRLRVLVANTLRELTDPASQSEGRREAALGRLLPLRISLSSLQTRAKRVSELLDEILDSEDDVADLCLSHQAMLEAREAEADGLGLLGDVSEDAAVEAAEAEAEEAEIAQERVEELIDVYDARLNSLCDQIEQLSSTIENTQDVLELTLDNERNRIARLELLLSMAGLAVGTCSAVSGFFGMNLISGLEEARGVFMAVVGASILLTGSAFVTCWRGVRSISRRQRGRLMDVEALKNVLANLDVVALMLRNRPALPRARKQMQDELASILSENGLPTMSTRELGILCSLLQQQQVEISRLEQGRSVLAEI